MNTSGVTTVLQVVVVQPLPADAVAAEQDATGTLEVLFGVQVVVVQLLALVAVEAVQVCTGTLTVLFGVQIVAVQAFPAEAGTGVHI